jgi:RNA polymerase sigma-70 factor, ECF subfamily
LSHNIFIQTDGQAAMKAHEARRRERTGSSETTPRVKSVQQDRGYDALHLSEEGVGSTIHDVHNRMVKILPRLRRFMHSLTNGADFSDDLIQETYVRALAHLDQWQPGSRLDSWMFRIARNLWIDHMRAENFRGEAVDIEAVDHSVSCDGQLVAENRIVLEQLRKDIAELSTDQRDVIRLVWGYGMSYKQTGKILNLPAGTVMSRMARVRDALQKNI